MSEDVLEDKRAQGFSKWNEVCFHCCRLALQMAYLGRQATQSKETVVDKLLEEFQTFAGSVKTYGESLSGEIEHKDSEAKVQLLQLTVQIETATTEVNSYVSRRD